ncbi:hypothetical protein ACGF5C_22780 [Micromonospora sp. NPDC047620]|uniref:hypothetical protein n=1 Tax=Micromonospora sp. NPDC047620 TaxID=3364251 RepID=UPI003710B3DC
MARPVTTGDIGVSELPGRPGQPSDTAVLDRAALSATLGMAGEFGQVADRLTELAYEKGAPDNIACVVVPA